MNPFPPPGLRHDAQPASGALARSRVLLETELRRTGGVVPRCLCEETAAAIGATNSRQFSVANALAEGCDFQQQKQDPKEQDDPKSAV